MDTLRYQVSKDRQLLSAYTIYFWKASAKTFIIKHTYFYQKLKIK